MLTRVPFVVAALLTASCSANYAPTVATAPIDAEFTRGGAFWDTGALIDFAVAARPVASEGSKTLAICGAWTVHHETALTIGLTETAVATGVVQINGQNVLRRPDRFPRLANDAQLAGANAACLDSGRPWEQAFADTQPVLRFVRQRYDCDFEHGFGGSCLTFRQLPTGGRIEDQFAVRAAGEG